MANKRDVILEICEQLGRVPSFKEFEHEYNIKRKAIRWSFGDKQNLIQTCKNLFGEEFDNNCSDIVIEESNIIKEKKDKVKTFLDKLRPSELSVLEQSIRTHNEKQVPVIYNKQKTNKTKFVICSDTHFGHKLFNEQLWAKVVSYTNEKDIDFVLHAGDILEGMSGRDGHVIGDLKYIGFDSQMDYAVSKLKEIEKPFYFITGNHDVWFKHKKDIGIDVGRYLSRISDDWHFLGEHEGNMIVNGTRIKLWHGNDGSAYSLSYRSQKFLESIMSEDTIPHLVITGHDHKSISYRYMKAQIIAGGCIQGQTGFMRGKKSQAHEGFWVVELESRENGDIESIKSQWVNK